MNINLKGQNNFYRFKNFHKILEFLSSSSSLRKAVCMGTKWDEGAEITEKDRMDKDP